MTQDSENQQTRPCGADVAAYALGALDDDEVQAFQRHLESCVVCRDELAAFQQVVDLLPLRVAAQRAPKSLRRAIMRAVEAEPKGQGTPQQRPEPRFAWARGLLPRPALALGAAVAVAALVIGGLQLGSVGGDGSTRVFHAQVTGAGSAEVRVNRGHAELVVHGFSPPPAGEIYEVWLSRPHRAPQPTSALFSVTAKGDGNVDVPGSLKGVTRVMVTPEPAGGSKVPTHPSVIRAALA